MKIREYNLSDKEACIRIFDSNCPKFFDIAERNPFINWLDHQGDKNIKYESPAYKNVETDGYYVIEAPDSSIIGCGGFYILSNTKEARLAWGMIHADYHKQGLGTALYNYRKEVIHKYWPQHTITLGTSQHTYSFYKKMGLNVTETRKAGYGADLDRYDMEL